VVGLLVAGVMAFAVFEPVQVLPRIGLGPGFSFVDQTGAAYTSEDGRGFVTLYTFAPTDCGSACNAIHETVSEVRKRVSDSVDLGEAEFRVVTMALDSSDPVDLAAAAADSGSDGESWKWVGAEEPHRKEVVGGGFEVYYQNQASRTEFDPVFVIVDGTGLIRGEYRYATLASDADRLTRHIALLGDEIRNSKGNAALIYEAAHVFLCYP
jgi:protein SCO1/2